MKTPSEKYRSLCEKESIPLFMQPWWLDAVAAGKWDVSLVEKGGEVVAALPYFKKKLLGFSVLTQPVLTPHLGPWLKPSDRKYAKRVALEKDLMNGLIDGLPIYTYYYQNWSRSQNNWLPFYWRGFSQTTRYTYVIDDLADLDHVWSEMQENIRREIRKARKQEIRVSSDVSIKAFIEINRKTFDRQGLDLPYTEEVVSRIASGGQERSQAKWFVATDPEGRSHAAVLIVWDSESAYYLMGGGDPSLRNSGATSLCMWEAITFASTVSRRFDFEGSMIEPIERFFRAFGARQVPYFLVTKSNSKAFDFAMAFARRNAGLKARLLRLLG